MTERCADFIYMLAMKTSCEGCARTCRVMNFQVSKYVLALPSMTILTCLLFLSHSLRVIPSFHQESQLTYV